MTEPEWLNGWSCGRMYDVVRSRTTTRQVRLFMVACCRLKTAEFFDPRIPIALEAAERCADDPSAETIADAISSELVTSPHPQIPQTGPDGELGRAITGAWQLLDEVWDERTGGVRYHNPQHAIAHAVYMSLRDQPRQVFTGGSGNAAEYCARMIATAELLRLGVELIEAEEEVWETETEVRRGVADLLRDIFGNPFRSVAFDPSWRTSTAVGLARTMYESRDFAAMPILADALEEAGCDSPDVLAHCRDPNGVHVRGCWVVDLVLGKS